MASGYLEKNCMWEIKGGSKAKRLHWDAEQNPVSWAYMKMLREHFDDKTIYDINPFIEVYRFRENVYGLFSPNCDGMGDVWMFLIIGPEKAFLIDTAYGLGDMPGLLREIIGDDREIIVANTHQGPDHALGNSHFAKCYCHEYMAPVIGAQNEHQWDYLFDENGDGKWITIRREDLPPFKPFELVPVPNHYTFDLGGGHEIELIWLPGHGVGHCGFLDKKNRIMFMGDDLVVDVSGVGGGPRPGMYKGEYSTLEALRNELEKLVKRMDEYDYLYSSHFMVEIENHVLYNYLEALNEVIEDPNSYTYSKTETKYNTKDPSQPPTTRTTYFKLIKGFSVLSYSMNGVYMNKRYIDGEFVETPQA